MSAEPAARERILESAYELFSHRGVRAVGIEEVIERAAVAKATLYRHFPSKDELVLEFLRKREEVAKSFHILMKGSIVQAGEGDVDAAKRAQAMAVDLIERYRP
jgi:AcrR family transcriptional regulator